MNSFKINPRLSTHRTDYGKGFLTEETSYGNPIHQFETWMTEVFDSGNQHANAMVLSTVNDQLAPSSRVVLLRNISYGGFTFLTNYQSRKASELEKNRKACLLFFWDAFERQVRVEGKIKRLPARESDEYFESRPFESKVGAWVSKQSTVIKNRKELEKEFEKGIKQFKNKKVPRPAHWGGYVLIPHSFEFWQGRSSRLHDRIRYTLQEDGTTWIKERLMP